MLAGSALLFVSGCATSGSPVAIAPDLPDIPARLESECPDPGVAEEAVTAVAENRVYAACNKRKHRDMKSFYRGVRAKLAGA